jgi:hypothetical protein
VGLSTLVTIMVTVLLTTFAVLTLVSARADLKLSSMAITSTQNYYVADGEAEEWLAKVDTFVHGEHGDLVADLSAAGYQYQLAAKSDALGDTASGGSGGDGAAGAGDAASGESSGDGANAARGGVLVDADGRVLLAETFPIDDKRDLIVEIALDSTGEIDILRWQSVSKRQG